VTSSADQLVESKTNRFIDLETGSQMVRLRQEKCVSQVSSTVILCVDDDPAGLMVRRLVLSIGGYDVLTATSGEEALRILRSSRVDLVITDLFLSGATGAEIVVSMKQTKPDVLVVLLTGSPVLPPDAELADLVLIKGIAPQEFLAAIAKVLEKRRGIAQVEPQNGGGSR
jgi:CheY-like chemotaxis protein